MQTRAVFEPSGRCQIVNSHGTIRATFPTIYKPGFNSQYPPPMSPDGAVLYVGSWEKGLYCYRAADGLLLWRKTPGKVRHIFPLPNRVVVEMANRGLYLRNQTSGELQRVAKMCGIAVALRLSSKRLFAGPTRRKYIVLDLPSLRIVEMVPEAHLNPERCLSFNILEARYSDDQLVISGWEEYPGGNYERGGQRDFSRCIRTTAA